MNYNAVPHGFVTNQGPPPGGPPPPLAFQAFFPNATGQLGQQQSTAPQPGHPQAAQQPPLPHGIATLPSPWANHPPFVPAYTAPAPVMPPPPLAHGHPLPNAVPAAIMIPGVATHAVHHYGHHVHHHAYHQHPMAGPAGPPPPGPPIPPPLWAGTPPEIDERPNGEHLDAQEDTCNAQQKNGQYCRHKAVATTKGSLPVCRRHKRMKLVPGYCQYVNGNGSRCAAMIKWKRPYAELCSTHRDWDGLPCHFMKLPPEVRMQIFSYLLPDKPVSAWLDRPLRKDHAQCTPSILRLNRQTSAEALEVLYGTQTYTVSFTKDQFQICGRTYPSPLDTDGLERSRGQFVDHRPSIRAVPAMLWNIRSMRLQMTLVKPLHPRARRPRPRLPHAWDDEVEVYDLRDSIRRFTSMLVASNKSCSLRNISFCLITQCLSNEWKDEELLDFYRIISAPFGLLNGLNSASLLPLLHSRDALRINATQYIPEMIRPYRNELDSFSSSYRAAMFNFPPEDLPIVSSDKVFWLPNSPANTALARFVPTPHHHVSPGTLLEARLHLNPDFSELQRSFTEALTGPSEPVQPLDDLPAYRAYRAFDNVYIKINRHYASRLPLGKSCYLHRARVAREKGDKQAIIDLMGELKLLMDKWLARELEALERKKNDITSAIDGFEDDANQPKIPLLELDPSSLWVGGPDDSDGDSFMSDVSSVV